MKHGVILARVQSRAWVYSFLSVSTRCRKNRLSPATECSRASPFSTAVDRTAPSNAKHAHPSCGSGHARSASPSSNRDAPPAPPPSHPVGRRCCGSRRTRADMSSMRCCSPRSGSCVRPRGPYCMTGKSKQRMLRSRSEGEHISRLCRSSG
jgi:hypothetical protein